MGLAALCPGTFDPVTNGHLDIIRRSARLFEPLVVAVLENPGKAPLFPMEERMAMLKEALSDQEGVEVASFSGLLVDFAARRGIGVVVKGVRIASDFDYERQMARINVRMTGVGAVFGPASPTWAYTSATPIKET